MRSTVICVDDDKWLLSTLSDQLSQWFGDKYTIEKALSGSEALDIVDGCVAEQTDISLVISDYIMPGMKGDELLEQIKLKTPMTRLIMLTGFSAIEGIANAINKAGIYRYLSKPWDAKDMMLTVLQAIRSYEQEKQTEQLNKKNTALCGVLKNMTSSLQVELKQAISYLATASELRDGGVNGHTQRVVRYATYLACEVGMNENDLKTLETAAFLHDVGKLGLNDTELEAARNLKCYADKNAARKQAEKAKEILGNMDKRFLPGIMYHTERADGRGAFGNDVSSIPLDAKIIGLCNYFDIVKSARENVSRDEVLAVMKLQCGKIFDESLFDKFAHIDLK